MALFQAKVGDESYIIHAENMREAIDIAEVYDEQHNGAGNDVSAIKRIKDKVINEPRKEAKAQPKLWPVRES